MTRPRVYVETTIPSLYHDDRPDSDIVARRVWTREWWAGPAARYELVTSVAVLDELSGGPADRSPNWLALLADLPLLAVALDITEIVTTYIKRRVMPADPAGDALHVALASYHKCDFLVTWNCRHLANANKFAHLRRVNAVLGLFVPALVTPLELMRGPDDGGE